MLHAKKSLRIMAVRGLTLRVLVTGCAGFIGSHVAERLVAEGHKVVCIDAFTDYYSPRIKKFNISRLLGAKDFILIERDINEIPLDELRNLMKHVDIVIHEAAQPGVRSSWGMEFEKYVRHNVLATQRLLEASIGTGIRRFVYASSSSVYGNQPSMPLREDMLPRPYSPYGVTKLAAENLANAYYENYGVPVVMLRYFTVYGPRQRPDMAFHRFILAILKGEPIVVYGDGRQMRDFTYVEDVVEATLKAAFSDNKDVIGTVINIGSGRPIQLIDVIKLLEDIIGVEAKIVYTEQAKGDVKATYADISRANKLLDWKPKTSIREGLEKEVAWVKLLIEKGLE